MTLFCFDVDGTLLTDEMENEGQYVKGIVPTELLIRLEKHGHKITIVSPSPYLPKRYSDKNHWFKEYGSNEYRWKNVQDAMDAYDMDAMHTVYIDDLEANRRQVFKTNNVPTCTPEKFIELWGDYFDSLPDFPDLTDEEIDQLGK